MTVHFNPLNHSPPFRPLIHGRISLLFLFNLLILLLLSHQTRPVGAQHGPPPPGSDPGLSPNQNFSPSMGGIIIVLIAALFFMGFFSIYIRHCSGQDTSAGGGTRRNLVGGRSNRGSRGLDPAVIESFPTFGFSHVKNLKIGKGALECAVCLNEFEGDDTLRLIPKCDHVFHTECIDAWLVAHTTCPVCRANLVPEPGESVQGPVEVQNDFVVEVQPEFEANSNESMEVPLHDRGDTSRRLNRNRTFKDMIRNMSGRPRWVGKYSRSFSTGHVAVKQWENMDRFTLRVPEEVRKQIMSGQLKRSTSLVVLPRESSSRRGYRTGFAGEGSSQRGRFSGRFDRGGGRSDRWVFSLVPPFFSRAPSVKSPRVAAPPSREGSLRSSRAVPGAVDSVRSVRGDVGFDYSARSGRVAV